jgi:hypothetical protein
MELLSETLNQGGPVSLHSLGASRNERRLYKGFDELR